MKVVDQWHIFFNSSVMYENFDPFSVCLYMTKSSRRLYDIQCMLYTKLMQGNDCRGLEIVRPHSISTMSTPTKKHAPNLPLLPPNRGHAPQRSASSQSLGSSNPSSVVSTPTGKFPPSHQVCVHFLVCLYVCVFIKCRALSVDLFL